MSSQHRFILKAAFLLAFFVFCASSLAGFFGITDLLTNLFYLDSFGRVAGEYEVRLAQVSSSYYEDFLLENADRTTTLEERRQAFLTDNGYYFTDKEHDHIHYALWAWLENGDPRVSQGVDNLLQYWADASCQETCEEKAASFRAMRHRRINPSGDPGQCAQYADCQKIYNKYKNEIDLMKNDWQRSALNNVINFNQVLQFVAGAYLFLQDYQAENSLDFTYNYYDYGTAGWGWKDFCYTPPSENQRCYARGQGGYNLFQLLEDYLYYHANWFVREQYNGYEGDSRKYSWTHLNAYLQIYDFASNQELKNKTKMLLDFLLLEYGLDFSADQWGGKAGRKESDGDPSYYTRKKDATGYQCILTGIACAYPAAYKPDYNIYLTSYRPSALILDVVDLSDEADDYWHENREYNEEVNEAGKGKLTYVTKSYNLGGGDNDGGTRYGWLLNIKSDDRDNNGYPLGHPFRLWTNDSPVHDNLNDYSSSEVPGGEFYHYRNALWSPLPNQEIHIFTAEDQGTSSDPLGSSGAYSRRLQNFDTYYTENSANGSLSVFEERDQSGNGQDTMVIIETSRDGEIFLEAAVKGVDYASLDAFKQAFRGRSAFNYTSKGLSIGRDNLTGDTTINGVPAYQYPFKRLETVDNQGNKIVAWNNQVMTVARHNRTCTYYFETNNASEWTTTGDCGQISGDCQCGSWSSGDCVENNCGGQNCASDQRCQTRTCDPSSCAPESQCVTDNSCVSSGPVCGDGLCQGNENQTNCPADCGGPCPYNRCQPGVTCSSWYNNDPASLCCVNACGGSNSGAPFNPPYPRSVFNYPAPEWHFTACAEFFSKFDMVAISGVGNACAQAIKTRSPQTLVFGAFGNMEINPGENDMRFEHQVFKDYDARLDENISPNAAEVNIMVTDPDLFESGRYGKSVFLVGPQKLAADRYNEFQQYVDRLTYADVDGQARELVDVQPGHIDMNHSQGEYFRRPIKAGGWTPNISDLNPFDQMGTIHLYIDEKYASKDASDFDGNWYDFFRITGTEPEFESVDFDLDWSGESDAVKQDAWQGGLRKMFDYEKQVSGLDYIITNDGFGVFPNDEVIPWHDGFVTEAGMLAINSWQDYYSTLRHWDEADGNKFILCPDGAVTWSADKFASFKNRFNDVRYGIATNSMGEGFYGRHIGQWYFMAAYYDEYQTDLGYPTGAPNEISSLCFNQRIDEWNTVRRCPYVRFFDKGAVIVNPTFTTITISESDISGLPGYSPGDEGTYWRFYGGQQPDFNNGSSLRDQPVQLYGADASNNGQEQYNDGDGILLFKQKGYVVVVDILVGNYNNNDTSPGSEPLLNNYGESNGRLVGGWNTRPGIFANDSYENNPYYSQWDQGDDSASEEGMGYFVSTDASAEAKFIPTIGQPGTYEVYEWHGWHGNQGGDDEASNVSVEIVHADGAANTTLNQKINAGVWNFLGSYRFDKGTEGYVKLSARGADGVVIADVVKFVYTANSAIDPPPDLDCGNGQIEPGEECDDGNTVSGDGCSAYCQIEESICDIIADLNCDDKVDILDFGILMSCWGATEGLSVCAASADPAQCKSADINISNGQVSVDDLGAMLSCWGNPNCQTSNCCQCQ